MLNEQHFRPLQCPQAQRSTTRTSPTLTGWRQNTDGQWSWQEPRRGSSGRIGYLPTPPSSFDYSQTSCALPSEHGSSERDMNGSLSHAQEPAHHTSNGYYASSKLARQQTGTSTAPPPGPSHLSQSQSYQSSRPASSVPSRVASPVFESHPSRKGSTNDGIHPYLQLPATISPSGGSVTEFAAQTTCLFWFESFTSLSRTEDLKLPPPSRSCLSPDAIPATGFLKWVTTILSTTQVTQNVVLLALLFIRRLKNQNPSVKGKPGSEYRLLTVALMLGNKFLDDNTYTNKTWAEVSGISVGEIHVMEVEFLSHMKYNLYTSKEDWDQWHRQLGHLWQFFNPPSPMLANGRLKQFGSRPPTIHIPRLPPSPPTSANASSPLTMNLSPGLPPYSAGPMLPHLAPPQIPPPQSLPGMESTFPGRKRSWDDTAASSVEPPAKRFHAMDHYTPRASTPIRLTQQPENYPRLPALPMPSLPYPVSQSMPAQNYPASSMPYVSNNSAYSGNSNAYSSNANTYGSNNNTPTRSLPSFNWPQSALQQGHGPLPTALQNPANGITSRSSRQSTPYSAASAHASPVHPTFSSSAAHTSTQHQLSPSYFLHQRSSPYRPVRNISTLLVAPPSDQMQDIPQQISHDQMRWQPLGRQTERQSGRVPYLHREAWPETHQWDQWPQLPINMRG